MKSASNALRTARWWNPILALGFAAASFALPFSARAAYEPEYDASDYDDNQSYSYVREIDGSAALTQGDSGEREEASINQPLLAGDRFQVSRGGRAEIVLSDSSLLRLDGDTEIILEDLAASRDANAERTRLRLLSGTLQIVVDERWLGNEPPRIDTDNATFYLQQAGIYLVRADRSGWSELVVRSGAAEVLTPRGSVLVRENEMATVDGDEYPRAELDAAPQLSTLERWGRELEQEASQADYDYVDDSLRYSASSLDRYGSWVEVENRRAWRPRVATDWRPYSAGNWRYTPSGYTWVSSETWGWVPYHYGTWDYAPHHGWVWYPGRVYSPAWVYWYWTPTHVGWCPVGYYSNHYDRHYRSGLRFGVYGWAGGEWGSFAHWNFLPTNRLRDHHGQARWVRPSYALEREMGGQRLGRGIITTDTRGITPDVLAKPEGAVRVLRTRPGRGGADLPDVTPFVARGELPPEVARQVTANKPAERVRATPLRTAAVAGGEKPELERRPVRTARPSGPAGEVGRAPVSGSGPRVLATKPKEPADWRESGKPEGGIAVQRRPAARPQDWREETTIKPAPGPSMERRPAARPARPVETKPAEGNPQPGVRLERRPAAPVVLPRGEAPTAAGSGGTVRARGPARDPVVRPVEVKPRESSGPGTVIERRPAARPEPSVRPQATQPAYRPQPRQVDPGTERRGQGTAIRPVEPRPSVSAPAPRRQPAPCGAAGPAARSAQPAGPFGAAGPARASFGSGPPGGVAEAGRRQGRLRRAQGDPRPPAGVAAAGSS